MYIDCAFFWLCGKMGVYRLCFLLVMWEDGCIQIVLSFVYVGRWVYIDCAFFGICGKMGIHRLCFLLFMWEDGCI